MASIVGFIAGLGQIRLTLELTPQSTPAGGDILAVAILTTERNPMPLEGQSVAFWLGRDEAASEPTDEHGRTSHTFTGLGLGTHAVSAQVAGIHMTQRHTFTKPKDEVIEAPVDLLVEPSGRNGKYDITITVLSTRAVGMPRRAVRIKDPTVKTHKDKLTNKYGTYAHHVEFTDRERFITVSVLGTKLSKTVRLFGPRGKGATHVPPTP